MKKKMVKLLLGLTMSAMVFSVSACGSKKEASDQKTEDVKDEEPEVTEEPTQEPTAEPTEEAADETEADTDADSDSEEITGKFATVEEMIASGVLDDQIDQMNEAYKEAGMGISIEGEGEKMIFIFKLLEIAKTDGMGEAMEQQFKAQEDTFKSYAKLLKAAVEVENPVVVLRCVDVNDEVVCEVEFPAE